MDKLEGRLLAHILTCYMKEIEQLKAEINLLLEERNQRSKNGSTKATIYQHRRATARR